jgi:hypothetical protein
MVHPASSQPSNMALSSSEATASHFQKASGSR